MTSYDAHRNRQLLARYYFRRAEHFAGRGFVDWRDQDLKDRGAVLAWRVRVLRNEQRRAQERLAKRIKAAREDAIRRWHPQRCATVHDIGRTIGRVK